MSLAVVLAVAGAGAGGAVVRFGAECAHTWWRSSRQWRSSSAVTQIPFPWATFSVNVLGSALLGWVIAAQEAGTLSAAAAVVLGVGFAGALTTYSTFSLDAYLLFRAGARQRAWLYLLASVLLSLVATVAGLAWGGR